MTGKHHDRDAEIHAAGAVLYRRAGDTIEVGLIHRPKHDDWSLPKGKLEPGEHVLAAAVREVREETGYPPVLGRPLGTVRYRVDGRPKRVDYWAGRAGHGRFVPGDEVDAMEWLPLPEAVARLSYAHDVGLLESLLPPGGPDGLPGTVPCILLRHASAGHKKDCDGDDLLRPLDERGRKDARALAGLLRCFAPGRVISSAAERCLGTVRPYAEQIGAAIETDRAFTVRAGHGDHGDAARTRITELIAVPAPVVICAHRENLPLMLAQARAGLGDPRRQDEPAPHKAGFWVLHIAGRKLAALEQHDLSGR